MTLYFVGVSTTQIYSSRAIVTASLEVVCHFQASDDVKLVNLVIHEQCYYFASPCNACSTVIYTNHRVFYATIASFSTIRYKLSRLAKIS